MSLSRSGSRSALAARSLAAAAVVILTTSLPAAAATSQPNDYYFAAHTQWALYGAPASINVPAAWCASTGSGIVVADIDTGADFSHEDLGGKLLAGAAFVNPSGDSSGRMTGAGQAAVADDNGHGTMTAGLIIANTNNRLGIAAVAPDARALIVKVIDSSGHGNPSDVAAGMRWAVDHGANVLNLSLSSSQLVVTGGVSDGSPISQAADYAAEHGVAVAFAAGNDSSGFNPYQLLEDKPTVLVVGALARDGSVPSYSNGGASIYAPGGDGYAGSDPPGRLAHNVVSTYNGDAYVTAAGTSIATPMVSGTFALLMAHGYSADGAKQQILGSARQAAVSQLDAAAALGVSPTSTCGLPAMAPPAIRPPTLRRAPSPTYRAASAQATVSAPARALPGAPSASIELVLPFPTARALAVQRPHGRTDPLRWALLIAGAALFAAAAVSVRRFG